MTVLAENSLSLYFVRNRTVAKVDSNRIRGSNVTPVFSGEIIKGKQSIPILSRHWAALGYFCFIRIHKIIKMTCGFIFVGCLPKSDAIWIFALD